MSDDDGLFGLLHQFAARLKPGEFGVMENEVNAISLPSDARLVVLDRALGRASKEIVKAGFDFEIDGARVEFEPKERVFLLSNARCVEKNPGVWACRPGRN
jgi:hypothetical protein